MKSFYVLLAISGLLLSCKTYPPKEDAILIKETFAAYQRAVAASKGIEAVRHVDNRTISYYMHIKESALVSDSAQVSQMPIMDKLMVLTLRHRMTSSTLQALDGRGIVAASIDLGLVGKAGIQDLSVDEVQVQKDKATATMLSKGKNTNQLLSFTKEQNNWKIDLTSVFNASAKILMDYVPKSGGDENTMLVSLLSRSSNREVPVNIWQPLLPVASPK